SMIGFRLEVNPGLFRVRETHHRYDYAVAAQDEGRRSQLARHLSFFPGVVSPKPRIWRPQKARGKISRIRLSIGYKSAIGFPLRPRQICIVVRFTEYG